MSDDERERKIRYAPRSVEAVFCEGCECLIDDAVFDTVDEARELARRCLRPDGRILCPWCADPKNLERLKAAAEAAKRKEVTP